MMSRRLPTGYVPPPHRSERFHTWPEAEYDAALHLLDRQVVDVEGRLVCKVDDVELTVAEDGSLVPTGLLAGMPALLPRFGGRLGRWLHERHQQLHEPRAVARVPDVIELDLVESVSSEVHLTVPRAGLLRPRHDEVPGRAERVRLGALLGLPVRVVGDGPSGAGDGLPVARRSQVLDVRLTAAPDNPGRQAVGALVVGPGRPGLLLGYDRRREPGPTLVAAVVRWLHRHARVVVLGPAVEIDREAGEVRVGPGAVLEPLLEDQPVR